MWGGLLLGRRHAGPGFALLFAGLPFARILTALMGGGDEKVLLLRLTGHEALTPALRVLLAVVVLLLAGLPVLLAARRVRISRPAIVLPLLLLLPLLLEFPTTHTLYNNWLQQGFGAHVFFAGTPVLIQAHWLLMTSLLLIFRHHLLLPGQAVGHQKERVAFRQPFTVLRKRYGLRSQ